MTASNDKTQTSTQTSTMFQPLQDGWTNALTQAQGIYNAGKKTAPTLAPLNPYTQQAMNNTAAIASADMPALNNAYSFADSMLRGQGTPAADALNQFASGQFNEDPRLQAMLDTNANRAANAAATRFGGGRYGSAAIGNGVGSAVADANNATMLQSNENNRNRQMQAAAQLGNFGMQAGAMLPTLRNLQFDGASRLAGIGDFFQSRDQQNQDITNNYKRDNLNWYAGILGGMGNLGGTTVSTTPKNSPSLAQGILGGAASGAAIGKMAGINPLYGALGGGILGAWA